MSTAFGWAMAVLAIALGYTQWGWQGAVLGISVVVFWLLLQFSRVMRVMRQATQAPVGQVDSAVMLHAKLHTGMRLLEILPLTRSLGHKLADEPETFAWGDTGGDRVVVELRDGRCSAFRLERAQASAQTAQASGATTQAAN